MVTGTEIIRTNQSDWFVSEELIELVAKGLPKGFKYLEASTGIETKWAQDFAILDKETGVVRMDIEQIKKCKMDNLVETPFTKATIMNKIGLNKEWKELDRDERWKLISKLKATLGSTLLTAIDQINQESDEAKKDS